MDLTKLTPGDQIMGISGIALLILSFLKWFTAEVKGSGQELATANGWNGLLAILGVLIGIAMVVYVVLKAVGTELPAANWPLFLLIAGGVAFLCILAKVLIGVSVEDVPDRFYDTKREFPAWIGLVASAGLAVGAFLNFQAARGGGGIARPGGSSGGPTV